MRVGQPTRSTSTLARMLGCIAHRGPDDAGMSLIRRADGHALDLACEGTARDVHLPEANRSDFAHDIALAHRRFSIVDLSCSAHQPFWSANRDVCVVFNGEIYNYVELRDELGKLGSVFGTTSDTEVLVEAYRHWGLQCFDRMVGFWAIVLYDARRRALLLSRDRIGKAPLYLARYDGALWFASEIKAILAATGRSAFPVRAQAVSDFIALGQRDVQHLTFFDGICSFPSAAHAWVQPDGTYAAVPYWRVPSHRLSDRALAPTEAAGEVRSRLRESLRVRLRADVPVALGLSGGLDSSALAALAASSGLRVKAYSLSFPGTAVDEMSYARSVQRHYSDAIDLSVIEQPIDDFFDTADDFVAHMDEPFHSPNMLTNQRVWRRMRGDGVRVSIDGGGGDEVLAGYPGITYIPFLEQLLASGDWPRLHRECVAFSEAPASPFSIPYFARLLRLARYRMRRQAPVFQRARRAWEARRLRARGLRLPVAPSEPPSSDLDQLLIEKMTDWQMNYWMRSGNLSSMGVPIEVRNPFLDHRVVELGFRLPTTLLVRDGWLKWILRKAVEPLLPPEVVWRPRKMGLPFPYREWLKASRNRFFRIASHADCPYLDLRAIQRNYEIMSRCDPSLLWRVMSVCLWWKRCVRDESLADRPTRAVSGGLCESGLTFGLGVTT